MPSVLADDQFTDWDLFKRGDGVAAFTTTIGVCC